MIPNPSPRVNARFAATYLSLIAGSPNNIQERRTSISPTACLARAVASPTVIGSPLNSSRYISAFNCSCPPGSHCAADAKPLPLRRLPLATIRPGYRVPDH